MLLKVGTGLEAARLYEGLKKNGSVLPAMSLQWTAGDSVLLSRLCCVGRLKVRVFSPTQNYK